MKVLPDQEQQYQSQKLRQATEELFVGYLFVAEPSNEASYRISDSDPATAIHLEEEVKDLVKA
jgi:hypothetical protein